MSRPLIRTIAAAGLLTAGFFAGRASAPDATAIAQRKRVFELRTYTTADGKLPALHARFRDHTMRLFTKHGMTNIGYWTPQDSPRSQNTLIYIVAHQSREAAKKNWDAFRADPDWQKAKAASEVGGTLVDKVDSVFMDATDYSQIK